MIFLKNIYLIINNNNNNNNRYKVPGSTSSELIPAKNLYRSINSNACGLNPCVSGTCVATSNNFYCTCASQSKTGDKCQENYCLHGTFSNFVCTCLGTPYYGKRCEYQLCGINEATHGGIDLSIIDKSGIGVITFNDLCFPINENAYSITVTRNGAIIDEGISRGSNRYIDSDLQYDENYFPGSEFIYCLRYIVDDSYLTQYGFLNGQESCQTLVIPWRGTIKGSVKTRPNTIGTIAGVPDINVCVWEKDGYKNQEKAISCAITNLDGSFSLEPTINSIENLQNFVLNANLPGHVILSSDYGIPTEKILTLDYLEEKSFDFVDNSTISIYGRVIVAGSSCGLSGVDLYKDGRKSGTTDSNGYFSLAVGIGANPLIKAVYPNDNGTESDHTFSPSTIQLPSIFEEYTITEPIQDTTVRNLEISNILGGICKIPIGTATVNLFIRDCQNSFGSIKLPPISYMRSLTQKVPAHRIQLILDYNTIETFPGVDLVDVVEFFKDSAQDSQSFDMRYNNSEYQLFYYTTPTIDVFRIPSSVPNQLKETCSPQRQLGVDGVVRKGRNETLGFRVYEDYQRGRCFSRNGTVSIIDFASSPLNGNTKQTQIDLTGAVLYQYNIIGDDPNLFSPYWKPLQLVATISYILKEKQGVVRASTTLKIAVLGNMALENTFTASTSRLPLMILRDPPGGSSYTEFTQGKSFKVGMSNMKNLNSGFGGSGEAGIGFAIDLSMGGGFGFITLTKATDINFVQRFAGSFDVSVGVVSEDSLEFNLEASTTLRTSQSIGLTGRQGDIIVGLAMIFESGMSATLDVIFDEVNACKFSQTNQVLFNPLSSQEDTYYIYTHFYVENILIPNLQRASSILTDITQKQQFENDLAQWQNILNFKDSNMNSASAPFSSVNNTVRDLLKQVKVQTENIFSIWDNQQTAYNVNPSDVALASLSNIYFSFVASLNLVGAVVFTSFISTYNQVISEIRNQGDISDIATELDGLKQTLNSLEVYLNKLNDYPLSSPKISFDGGIGIFEQTITTTSSRSTTFQFQLNMAGSNQYGSSFDGKIFGIRSKSESLATVQGSVNIGKTNVQTFADSNTITFYLGDSNPLDSFVINVLEDPYYGVPVFQTLSARTSCPHELGTEAIEKPFIKPLSSSQVFNVDPNSPAIFSIQIGNFDSVIIFFFF